MSSATLRVGDWTRDGNRCSAPEPVHHCVAVKVLELLSEKHEAAA